MPKFETLQDNFAINPSTLLWSRDLNKTLWDPATQSIRITMDSSYNGNIYTIAQNYDITSSYLFFRLLMPSVIPGDAEADISLVKAGGGNQIQVDFSGSTVSIMRTTSPPLSVVTLYTATYNPAIHSGWWRFREAAGTVYVERSADGAQWTTLTTMPTLAWMTTLDLEVTTGSGASTSYLYLDNVNIAVPTTWARLTGPKGDRGVPPIAHAPPVMQNLVLVSPFVQYDTSWTLPRVVRTWDNLCFMEGLIRRSDNAAFPGIIFTTLPPGFRPSDRTLLNSVSSADGTNMFTRIDVDPNGDVTFQSAATNAVWLSAAGRWYAVQ